MKRLCWIAVGALLLGSFFGGLFAGCGGGTAEDTTSTSLVADKYPVPTEHFKIGVILFSNTDLQMKNTMEYFNDYLGPKFNCEFVTSEDIDDAEAELAFIENCGVSGCQGIIAFQRMAYPQTIYDKCREFGMYYVKGSKPVQEDEFEMGKDNPYFVGGVMCMGDRALGYDNTMAFIEDGARSFGIATGGKPVGNYQHTERTLGFYDAIDEWNAANATDQITVLPELPGFTNDAWFAGQAQMIAANPDAIIATFAVEENWPQPLADAGKAGVIKLGGVGSLNDVSAAAMESGTLNWLGGMYAQMSGLPFALLYNWMTGYSADFSDNGQAIFVPQNWMEITSAEELNQWVAAVDAPVPPYSADDLKAVCKAFNPDATLEEFQALALASDLASIEARRAADN